MKLTLPKCFLAALAGLFIVLATQIPVQPQEKLVTLWGNLKSK